MTVTFLEFCSVFQSQLQLSADCSSPASYDEQNEAFDTPEDPMSEAESVVVTAIFSVCFLNPQQIAHLHILSGDHFRVCDVSEHNL